MPTSDREYVAQTAALLAARAANRAKNGTGPEAHEIAYIAPHVAARDALELHRIATRMHHWSERNCNEDLGCRKCDGSGMESECDCETCHECDAPTVCAKCGNCTRHDTHAPGCPGCSGRRECAACAGRGHTLGRREARAEDRAREIAAAYGLRVYFQGDPRGCPVYLIPEEALPVRLEAFPDYVKGYARDAEHPPTVEDLQGRWLSSCYNSAGVAVCHLGR